MYIEFSSNASDGEKLLGEGVECKNNHKGRSREVAQLGLE